jgi:ribosome biogenesis protein Tsr3
MRHLSEIERAKLRRLIEKKGRAAALLDRSAKPILTAADRTDVARKGFLQAIADCCVVVMDPRTQYRLSKEDVLECLKGAIDGMEHT